MNNGIKMTRSHLKSLVKECLVEILQEGLGSMVPTRPNEHVVESRLPQGKNAQQVQRPRSASLDTPLVSKKPQLSKSLIETIRHESNGNSIMADILADTATTTLPKMLSGGDSSNMSHSTRMSQVEHFNGTPEQVFGDEVASRWANLAFMDVSNRKMS
jgi:hypothetical protein